MRCGTDNTQNKWDRAQSGVGGWWNKGQTEKHDLSWSQAQDDCTSNNLLSICTRSNLCWIELGVLLEISFRKSVNRRRLGQRGLCQRICANFITSFRFVHTLVYPEYSCEFCWNPHPGYLSIEGGWDKVRYI